MGWWINSSTDKTKLYLTTVALIKKYNILHFRKALNYKITIKSLEHLQV